jgi:hypothetical protein
MYTIWVESKKVQVTKSKAYGHENQNGKGWSNADGTKFVRWVVRTVRSSNMLFCMIFKTLE